ncbi:MAG: pyridoxamine 5-phosphate oxidase [Frankiales bacterium]|jgi:pyridoxamine 5'-phosphate oxidase|nr:pyridoxamine 5-phosphate oxidase [Frankiales bacterium]
MDPDRLAALRREYREAGLTEGELAEDPYTQFALWLADASAADLHEPNAMVVSTADADGRPSARHVLLKEYGAEPAPGGFVFYTNRFSRKAREIADNPAASLVFPWFYLQRQVVVLGTVEEVSRDQAAAYFATRPRGAQVGAWASRQSEVIPSRAWLEERRAEIERRFPDEVPLPDFWGGFRVVPGTVEFWQGREDRLHDRLRYLRGANGWDIERLSP